MTTDVATLKRADQSQAMDVKAQVDQAGRSARQAARAIAGADTNQKNAALSAIADAIVASEAKLLASNAVDMQRAQQNNIGDALLDRLELTPARIAGMAEGLLQVARQPDPVGTITDQSYQPSGLHIGKMSVPLGVIGIIYESRPNVTADAAGLCIKSGNACILRGGSEAIESNRAIAECIQLGLENSGLPKTVVQLLETTDRAAVGHLIQSPDFVDVIIPRGGKSLVARISDEARVPVIKHLEGICHVYVDEHADLEMAVEVAFNSKTYRYGICGAMETLLVSSVVASDFLPAVAARLVAEGVELRGCDKTCTVLDAAGLAVVKATEEDWSTEYLAPVLSVKVVGNMQEAVDHIEQFGSQHTDAIVTNSLENSRFFTRAVDSSSVMVNAATCFADGYQYGLGAEIGISTDKLHVRGPVGVDGLTTAKFVVIGQGNIRQ